MKTLLSLLFIVFAILTTRAENYKLIRVQTGTGNEIEKVARLGIEVEHAVINKDNSFELFVSDTEATMLRTAGVQFTVVIANWIEHYNALPKMSPAEKSAQIQESREKYGVAGFGFGSMGGYYTYAEAVAQLDTMARLFPNLVSPKFSIGTSEEGKTIWAAKISDNPNTQESEPRVLFDGLIHAREPQAMACVLYYMYYLLENYGSNSEVTYLVNNREIFFVPVVNPDGYEYNRSTNPSGGGMWRKNRKNSGSAYGIDLNRNYGYMWGYDNVGSSPTPSDETYRGTAAFSEKETQVIRDLALAQGFKTYINYHAYNNSIIYPWGYTNGQTPDSATYREFASYMSSYNGYDYGTSYQTLGYNSNGTGRDWMYGEQTAKGKVYGYVLEVGTSTDGFWPAQNRIIPLAQGNIRPNLYQTWLAGDYVAFDRFVAGKQYINPGDSLQAQIYIKNRGLGDGAGVDVQISSPDAFVTVYGGSFTVPSVPARGSAQLPGGVPLKIASSAPVDVNARLVVKTLRGGITMSQDTVKFLLGTPVFLFNDTTNNPSQLWTITSSPVTPTWEATTTDFNTSPNSYTDSKTGTYANNATVTLTSTGTVNLAGRNNARLTFYTKYDIESRWDCGVVLISTNNGSTYTPLAGTLTKAASGSGKQTPTGIPIYDNLLSTWTREDMSLSAYAGQQIKIRFELRTDGSQQKDGWYLDDIGVSVMGVVPVELTSFTWLPSEDGILFNWKTATETNNSYFELQQQQERGWVSVARINGNGTTPAGAQYSYLFNGTLQGTSLFRLKQVDYSGAYTIYGPYNVEAAAPEKEITVRNFPNPFTRETEINYSLKSEQSVVLNIYNTLGQLVETVNKGKQQPGKHTLSYTAAKLPAGVYYAVLNCGDKQSIVKMVKQ